MRQPYKKKKKRKKKLNHILRKCAIHHFAILKWHAISLWMKTIRLMFDPSPLSSPDRHGGQWKSRQRGPLHLGVYLAQRQDNPT